MAEGTIYSTTHLGSNVMKDTRDIPSSLGDYGRTYIWLSVAALQLFSVACNTAQQAEDLSPHSAAELIPEDRSVRAGEPFTVALRLTLDPGWHSYWLNPGDAGQPAAIDWDLPAGYSAGELQWPFPRMVEESTVVSYGYEDEVMLLTEFTPPHTQPIGNTVRFAAEARWLVCANICLPAMANLEFEVQIGEETAAPNVRWQAAFAATRSSLPVVAESWAMSAFRTDDGFFLQIVPANSLPPSFEGAFFFASDRGVVDHGAEQRVSRGDGAVRLSLVRSRFARGEPARLKGVLVMPDPVELGLGQARAVAVDVAVSSDASDRYE